MAKSLFTSARAGASHICGSLSGREEVCVAFNIFLYVAGVIVGFLLLSLLLSIAGAVKGGAPRLESASVLCHRVGLALVVVGFALTMGMYKVGQQLQQALGGQVTAGVAVIGGYFTFGVAILCLAADAYFSYRRRGSLRLGEDQDLRAGEARPTSPRHEQDGRQVHENAAYPGGAAG